MMQVRDASGLDPMRYSEGGEKYRELEMFGSFVVTSHGNGGEEGDSEVDRRPKNHALGPNSQPCD